MTDGAYAFDGSRVLATERAGCAPLPITEHPSGINVISIELELSSRSRIDRTSDRREMRMLIHLCKCIGENLEEWT